MTLNKERAGAPTPTPNQNHLDPDFTLTPLPRQAKPHPGLGERPHRTVHHTAEGYVLVSWPGARAKCIGGTPGKAHQAILKLQDKRPLPTWWEGAR